MSGREAALLSEGFLDNYPSHPEHMSPLGLFTFYRTYSRLDSFDITWILPLILGSFGML